MSEEKKKNNPTLAELLEKYKDSSVVQEIEKNVRFSSSSLIPTTELKIHPNYTIQAISEESGFANTRNFQRLFKAAFDMTPSDYKKIVQEKQHREPPMD